MTEQEMMIARLLAEKGNLDPNQDMFAKPRRTPRGFLESLGSTGLGGFGPAMEDYTPEEQAQMARANADALYGLTPIPAAKEAKTALERFVETGHPAYAAQGAANATIAGMQTLPFVGPASKALGMLAQAPKAAAAVAGGTALMASADDAEGQAKLTKAQQREQLQIEAEAKRRREDEAAKSLRGTQEAERLAQMKREDEAIRAEQERKNKVAEAELANQLAEAERNKTFAQKHPEWADALPAIGLAIGGGIPLAGKAIVQQYRNAPIRNWEGTIKELEAARKAGDAGKVADSAKTLEAFNRSMPNGTLPVAEPGAGVSGAAWDATKKYGPTAAAGLFGGGVAAEAVAFPDQWNLANLPVENPEREEARKRLRQVSNYGERAAMGALTGSTFYKAGGWLRPDKNGPIQQSQALAARYGDDAAGTLQKDAIAQQQLKALLAGPTTPPGVTMDDIRIPSPTGTVRSSPSASPTPTPADPVTPSRSPQQRAPSSQEPAVQDRAPRFTSPQRTFVDDYVAQQLGATGKIPSASATIKASGGRINPNSEQRVNDRIEAARAIMKTLKAQGNVPDQVIVSTMRKLLADQNVKIPAIAAGLGIAGYSYGED